MTPERWQRLEALFHAAHALPVAERVAFLHTACPEDDALRRDVESLLVESEADGGLREPLPPSVLRPSHPDAAPGAMAGATLGSYHLQALLGSGGMGDVYRARDTTLGRDVAVKILPPAFTSDPGRLARFEREARMLAALNHPNICAIHDVGDAVGIRFLVLEFVDGDTLATTLGRLPKARAEGGGLPLRDAVAIARQIADALEAAHERGIVHRDLKPANICLTRDGVVKVLDFGLAKTLGGEGVGARAGDAADTSVGALMGTAAYMSPEQARGLPVDRRTDIWAFGCLLYEMLTGRVAFAGDTASDSIVKILERAPDWTLLPEATPPSLRRLLLRCLAKDPKLRLRDVGDVRLELDALDEPPLGASGDTARQPSLPRRRSPWRWVTALVTLAVGAVAWEGQQRAQASANPLVGATFSSVTNWAGTEEHAEISPDGRFVAFLADRAGQLDIWAGQLGTGSFDNLTRALPPMLTPGNLLRSLGFSGDGAEIWFSPSGNPASQQVLMALTGGTPRPFLRDGYSTPAWSPDNTRLAYIASKTPGDPISIADRTGADARPIVVRSQGPTAFFRRGVHAHNPVWSQDGRWIYFVYGADPFGQMEVWRMRPSGESPEQLTTQNAPVNYLTPLDARTVLYVARADDWSGPWLWALDVERKVTRRVTVGLEQYSSVSASRDGRRLVATVARPTTTLWQLPVRDRLVGEGDAEPYPLPVERALAPRFGGTSLFYLSLSARGTGDGLWRWHEGQAYEVRKGADGILSEPPVVSPDGSRVAVVVRQGGARHLAVMAADGTDARTLATSIDIQGVAGQGAADWSPDGRWIVTGGSDAHGPGLFKVPVDGGPPVLLVSGEARGPVWSPTGALIVYATPFAGAGGRDLLKGVRPDGSAVPMPEVGVRLGGAHRFLRSGTGVIYLPAIESKDFWLVDLGSNTTRQLTDLTDRGYLNTFDITPDGAHLVFDRSRQNSDVVLIELPPR